jgi:hypothetical protein
MKIRHPLCHACFATTIIIGVFVPILAMGDEQSQDGIVENDHEYPDSHRIKSEKEERDYCAHNLVSSSTSQDFENWFPLEVGEWPGWHGIDQAYLHEGVNNEWTILYIYGIIVCGTGPDLSPEEERSITEVVEDLFYDKSAEFKDSGDDSKAQGEWLRSQEGTIRFRDYNYVKSDTLMMLPQSIRMNKEIVKRVNAGMGKNRINGVYIAYFHAMK